MRAIEPQRTLLTGVMRTATTDATARAWFRRYWTFGVGSGAHVLVQAVVDTARELAESTPPAVTAPVPCVPPAIGLRGE